MTPAFLGKCQCQLEMLEFEQKVAVILGAVTRHEMMLGVGDPLAEIMVPSDKLLDQAHPFALGFQLAEQPASGRADLLPFG